MQRSGLRVLHLLSWVVHDLWWLDWIVASVATLDSIANIDVDELSTFGDCDSSWPLDGPEDVDGIANSALTLVILLRVAADLGGPSDLERWNWVVLLDGSEPLLSLVLLGHLGHVLLYLSLRHSNRS